MRTSWQIMKWRGVPVVLSWTMLLALPWFYYRQGTWLGMATALLGADGAAARAAGHGHLRDFGELLARRVDRGSG